MRKTPLLATHGALNAQLETFGDWILPAAFQPDVQAGIDAEVAATRAGAGIFDLAYQELLVLSGDDVRRWINSMFTNKYAETTPGQGRRSVIVDDRGRVQGLVDWYCMAEDRFLGVLEGVTVEWFENRFRMVMMLDDIELDHLDDVFLLSLQGPATDAVLGKMGLPVPQQDHDHLRVDDSASDRETLHLCRKDRTGLGGVDLLVPQAVLATTWSAALGAGAVAAGQHAQDALRIFAGRAAWPIDGTEKSMVHELHYNLDSVSFDKGCYLGQEVINRIERRGGIKKKLLRLRMDADAVPPADAEVALDDKVIGRVSSAIRLDGQAWVLATIREAAWAPGTAVQIRAGDKTVGAVVDPA